MLGRVGVLLLLMKDMKSKVDNDLGKLGLWLSFKSILLLFSGKKTELSLFAPGTFTYH